MTRRCAWCYLDHDYLAMPVVGVQAVAEGEQSLELRNDPHGSTVAEVAGHVLAARHVRVGAVRIEVVS